MNHIERSLLERFMRGSLPRPETRVVVRHLLAGCPMCSQVTRRLWRLGTEALRPAASLGERAGGQLRLVGGLPR